MKYVFTGFITICLWIMLFAVLRTANKMEVLQQELVCTREERDSVIDEVFILKTEISRHEIAREEILRQYPEVYEAYNMFLSTETE